MRRSPYLFALMIFLICVVTDLLSFVFDQPLAGVLLVTSTLIVYFAAHVWFVHFPENQIRLKHGYMIIPLAVVAYMFFNTIKRFKGSSEMAGETLLSQGQLLMSRLQGGLWIMGLILISTFVLVASLLEKKKYD